MAKYSTDYQTVFKTHNAATLEALKRLHNSRSKFKDADPATLEWHWNVAIAVSSNKNFRPVSKEIAVLDPQEYVKQAMTGEMSVYLCVHSHMYHSNRVFGPPPMEIVQETIRQHQPMPWNGPTVHLYYPGAARPGIHELRVCAGMVPVKHPDRPRLVVGNRDGKPYSLLLAQPADGFMGMNGGINARLKKALDESMPGEIFTWDRTTWRRMDLPEIQSLVSAHPFWKTGLSMDAGGTVFSMPEYGAPRHIPLDTPVYPLDAMHITSLPAKETLGERIHRLNHPHFEESPCTFL
jgi:hypothetical protein